MLVSFLALSGFSVLPAQAQTARDTLPIVRDIRIAGNRAFSDAEIERAIFTRESGCKSVFLAPLCLIGLDFVQRRERLDPREFRTDVARIRVFYFRRGFRWAQVDTALFRDSIFVDVRFSVQEGPAVMVRSLRVEGLEEVQGAASLLRGLPLAQGGRYSEVDISAAKDQIERGLANRGYARAAVLLQASIARPDSLLADVVLEVDPGPRYQIGPVRVTGADKLDTADVRRMLTFRSGDLYRESEIIRSQRALYSMALFNYVDISALPTESDSAMDIRVQVNEASMRGVQFGLGVSTTECVQLEAGWSHRNLFGGTRRLEIKGVLSNLGAAQLGGDFPCQEAGVRSTTGTPNPYNKVNWRLRADFTQPWFLGTDNRLQLGLFGERQSVPNIYALQSYGGDVRLYREIGRGTTLTTAYRAGRDVFKGGSAELLFCAGFGVCRPEDVGQLSGKDRWLNWFSLSLARSRTDAVLNPARGYRLTLEAETASRLTLSRWAYYRAQGEFSWYRRVLGRSVLGLRLRGGWVRPISSGIEDLPLAPDGRGITHPLKRQYAGGAFTVRGYAQNLLGPKVLLAPFATLSDTMVAGRCDPANINRETNEWVCDLGASGFGSNAFDPRPIGGENSVVANLELRVPLGSGRWTAVAFVDIGQVWTKDSEFKTTDLPWSPGLGLRYRSPVGPLRLDVGYNTSTVEELPVVVGLDNGRTLVQVVRETTSGDTEAVLFRYNAFEETGLRGFLNRLQLHFSIGQAF